MEISKQIDDLMFDSDKLWNFTSGVEGDALLYRIKFILKDDIVGKMG